MKLISISVIIVFACLSCKRVYNPRAVKTMVSYLVVEGNINTGMDSTIIHLSRTVPLASKTGTRPELGAIVDIVGDGGASYPCIETGQGYYEAAGLNVNSGDFGLKINTTDGKVYQSDMVPVKNSPPIDSVYYKIQSNGLEIYADTHDPANNTKYYRWDYVSTYKYHSFYDSFVYLQTVPVDSIMQSDPAHQVYQCWRSETPSNILLNSTAKLAKDVIYRNPIQFIESTSEKIANRYSILVKQYALTPDAYNYYQQLKKNTEQLGGVFDPQPSELPGNIHPVSDPLLPVIGYVTAGSVTEVRIFIDNRDLPAWLPDQSGDPSCAVDTDMYSHQIGPYDYVNDVKLNIYSGLHAPISAIQVHGEEHPRGYLSAIQACVDCTLRGTNVRPAFWTDEQQR